MEEIKSRLSKIALSAVLVVGAGIIGYRLIEGWSTFDSLYMTVITLATVGYSETHPLSNAGRAFTIVLILTGIGVVTYAVTNLTAMIVDGELRVALRRRRMETRISQLAEHYIICGAGHTGMAIIEELSKTRRGFLVIEKSEAAIERLQAHGVLMLQGDATDEEVLTQAGIERARGLFGALPTDPDNAFVAITARGLNPKLRIVCQQEKGGSADKLRRSGADIVVNPGFIGGLRMASEMIRPAAVGFLDSMIRAEGKVFRIEEITVPAECPLMGHNLEKIKGAEGHSALLLAIKVPDARSYEFNPASTRRIVEGEVLVVMGSIEQIRELETRLGVRKA